MVNILGLKLGRYILYELSSTQHSCDTIYDNNVRLVTNIDQLKYNTLGIQPEAMDRLLQNNTELFVYIENDYPLGMMWGHRGSCYVRGPGIPLLQDKDTVYWFWVFTLPEARGKNVYKRLKNAFFNHYKDSKGFTALVEPSNSIMRREMNKIGFKETKQYFYIKLLNTSLIFEQCITTHKFIFHIETGNRHNLVLI